jgi:Oxidoreductase molybdopterin binding domain
MTQCAWLSVLVGIGLGSVALSTPVTAAESDTADAAPSLSVVDERGTEHRVTDADLAKLPRVKAQVTDHADQQVEYEGVQLADVLQAQGITLGKELRGPRIASYLLLEAEDGYRVVLAIGEVDPATTSKVVLLADKKNGAALPEKEGPWRIVIPDEKRPVRWIRMLKRIAVKSAIDSGAAK